MFRIKLLAGAATLALLAYGGVEALESMKFSHVQVMPYTQFVQKRPQEGWFRITGGRLDVVNVLVKPGHTSREKQYYIPLISPVVTPDNHETNSPAFQEEPCYAMVATTDPKMLEVDGVVSSAGAGQVSFPTHDVEGTLRAGLNAGSKEREQISRTSAVASDFVVLDQGRKPSLLKGLGLIVLGLILLVGQILYYRSDWHDA